MAEHPHVILKHSGYLAVIEPDRWVSSGFMLVVDGTPQSHVNLDDPAQLSFEYVARIGHVIDQLGMPGEPITAVHLGAGALTLPRYIHATRPGSRQQVLELEPELVDLVRRELPLPRNAGIRIRYGDARAVLAKLPSGLAGQADLVVVDIFSGARTPAHVTSVEFYREAILFLPVPRAARTIESEVQAEAGERGLNLLDILFFRENAIHGLALWCVGLMEHGLPWFDKAARPKKSEISAPRHQRVPIHNLPSAGSQPHS